MGTFESMLRDLRQGEASCDINRALEDLTRRCQDTGKSGTLTLTVTINPKGNGRCLIDDKISTKAPVTHQESTLFFIGAEGELSRRDPKQLRLEDLRSD